MKRQLQLVGDAFGNLSLGIVFPYFANLPAELQVRIWVCALESARSARPAIVRQKPSFPYMFKEKAPALLHVNQAARYEAARYYTSRSIAFPFRFRLPDMILFFHPGAETLFLDTAPSMSDKLRGCSCILDCNCRNDTIVWSYIGCPCSHASLANRHTHLLRQFLFADTSAVKHVALHFDVHQQDWGEFCCKDTMRAFPTAWSLTFVVPLDLEYLRPILYHQPPIVDNFLSTWYATVTHVIRWMKGYREKFPVPTFDVWVKNPEWMKLERTGGGYEECVIERRVAGTLLEDLLNAGL
jgi:hypothetical protein